MVSSRHRNVAPITLLIFLIRLYININSSYAFNFIPSDVSCLFDDDCKQCWSDCSFGKKSNILMLAKGKARLDIDKEQSLIKGKVKPHR